MYESLALVAGFILVYSTIAGRVEESWVSGPILFIGFGLIVGPVGLDLLSFDLDRESLRTLAEWTLALVLFTDAAGADLGVLRRVAGIPVRLLVIGLPLTIASGYFAGRLLDLPLSVFEMALIATMLAPTDAALGEAVVTNESVPNEVRQSLNVESGLNDGICVPILFVFLALAQEVDFESGPWTLAVGLVGKQIGIGLAVGLGWTAIASWLIKRAAVHDSLTATWQQIPVIALAFTCFSTAQYFGGSGFIASFTGGLLFGALTKRHKEGLLRAARGTGETFALITWVIFGSAVIGRAADAFSWSIVIYAASSLTVIRMLPVLIALTGAKLDMMDKLFIGWFGPRGLASIVFAVIVVNANLPNSDVMAMIVASTVVMSVLAHGVTANPWVDVYRMREVGDAHTDSNPEK